MFTFDIEEQSLAPGPTGGHPEGLVGQVGLLIVQRLHQLVHEVTRGWLDILLCHRGWIG